MNAVDDLLGELVARGGSDLHLLAGLPPRLRLHGELENVGDVPADVPNLVSFLLEGRHARAFEEHGQVDLAYEIDGLSRFRVNIFRHHHGLGAVLRRIPTEIPLLADLGMPDAVRRFTEFDRGLVLVTGPTGSGKSSTLAALLEDINQREARHIVTIEDPIEFVYTDRQSSFTQREVGEHTVSFAEALRSAARQNPDLILVGEMRDRETIEAALTLAEMGMLVFSTVHTNSAGRTIDRIVEVFREEEQPLVRTMLASCLRGVLSQILCRTQDEQGRVVATELLFSSTALRAVIREGASHKVDTLFQAGRKEGMHRLDDSLFELASQGVIAGEDAYDKCQDKQRFSRFLPDDAGRI